MSLSSLNLDASQAVAKTGGFSSAAKSLGITQSALSQRVMNLESDLGTSLFLRESSGVRLTALGENLLRYCQSKELLENEFLSNLQNPNSRELGGIVRIAGFSTVTKSLVVPALADFILRNPKIQLEISSAEVRDLPQSLASGKVDFIFLNHRLDKQGIENVFIGDEENVLIRSAGRKVREQVYLDHDVEDTTTADFFRVQGKKIPQMNRNFLDEIYLIIEGVRKGLGQAVVPLHIAQNTKGVEVVPGYKPLKIPIYLVYYTQAFYTRLQTELIDVLKAEAPRLLRST